MDWKRNDFAFHSRYTLRHLRRDELGRQNRRKSLLQAVPRPGRTKFTTSGAHDVIAITSPQKNDLCTEELRGKTQDTATGRGQSTN